MSSGTKPSGMKTVNWTGLSNVTWGEITHIYLQLDNVSVSESNPSVAVPEPASAALLFLGIAGLGLSRRKKTT